MSIACSAGLHLAEAAELVVVGEGADGLDQVPALLRRLLILDGEEEASGGGGSGGHGVVPHRHYLHRKVPGYQVSVRRQVNWLGVMREASGVRCHKSDVRRLVSGVSRLEPSRLNWRGLLEES